MYAIIKIARAVADLFRRAFQVIRYQLFDRVIIETRVQIAVYVTSIMRLLLFCPLYLDFFLFFVLFFFENFKVSEG